MGLRRNNRIDPSEVATAEEAAAALKRAVPTVWRWAARGDLRTFRYYGRTVFLRGDITALARRLASRHTTKTDERRPGQGTAPRGGGGDANADPTP